MGQRARTYALGGLRTDGEAGTQQAPQCRGQLQLGSAPAVEAGPEQDGEVTHLREGCMFTLAPVGRIPT